MKLATITAVALFAHAPMALATSHSAPDTNVLAVAGASTCPDGTVLVHTGTSVIFKNTNSGNITEDARCWVTPPATSVDAVVVILGPCVVCRFGR